MMKGAGAEASARKWNWGNFKTSAKWTTHGAQMRWKRIEPWRSHGEIRFLMQVCDRLSPFR